MLLEWVFGGIYADLIVSCRLEKRRKAMLEMPQMIQTWKQVSSTSTPPWYLDRLLIILFIERTWSWMEEVAEIEEFILNFWREFDIWIVCTNIILNVEYCMLRALEAQWCKCTSSLLK